jgi:hypothetical protein
MKKIQICDPGSGISIWDHISKRLVTIFFGLKILKYLMYSCGSGSSTFLVLDTVSAIEEFGSGIYIPDQQHWI